MTFTQITYEEAGPVGTITINRPDDGNMFTETMCHEIRDCIELIRRETRTRVIVLTGAGDKFFCIGGQKDGMEKTKLYAGTLPTLEMYEAIDKLQKAPVPGGLRDVSAQFFDELARHFPFGQRLLFANRWLFGPLIERVLSATPATNAVLRTTTAPTMLQGSEAANVLPTQAIATVNFRLHPRDTIDGVVAYVRETINDERVAVQAFEPDMTEASAVSDSRAVGYQQIRSATQAAFGDVIFVAGLTVAGTDSTHYVRIAQDSYRFNPFLFNRSDLTRMHGIDERLSVENLARGMLFYQRLLREQ